MMKNNKKCQKKYVTVKIKVIIKFFIPITTCSDKVIGC